MSIILARKLLNNVVSFVNTTHDLFSEPASLPSVEITPNGRLNLFVAGENQCSALGQILTRNRAELRHPNLVEFPKES